MSGLFAARGCGWRGHFRHTVVAATLVKAGSHRVLPLEVEEVRNSDGHAKQDCELNAAKRLIPRLRQDHPQMPLIVGGDDLYAHEPFIAQLRTHSLQHVLVCKPGSHAEVYKWVEALARLGACEVGQWTEGPACPAPLFRVPRGAPDTADRDPAHLVYVRRSLGARSYGATALPQRLGDGLGGG